MAERRDASETPRARSNRRTRLGEFLTGGSGKRALRQPLDCPAAAARMMVRSAMSSPTTTVTIAVAPASVLSRLRQARGSWLFAVLVVAAVALIAAACVGTVRRLGGADPGLSFSSLRGHVTRADDRWSTVERGDAFVEIAGRPVASSADVRAAWTAIRPGSLTMRFRRGGEEWEETARARPRGLLVRLGTWLRVLTGGFLLAAAVLVFAVRPGRPVTWVFLLFCFALAFHLLIYLALLPAPAAGVLLESLGLYATAGAAVWLFSLFPRPLSRRRRWAALLFSPFLAAASVLALDAGRPSTDESAYETALRVIYAGYPVAILAGLACIILLVVQLVRARRREDGLTASKCRALFVAVTIGLVLPAALGLVRSFGSEFDFAIKSFPIVVFVGITAYSIVRHNAFDIDRFTAVVVGYGATVAGLGLAFALLLVGLPSLVGWSGVTRSPVAGAVSATLFFLLFSPVYRRVRGRVDRVFLRAGVAEAERLRLLRGLADGVRTDDLSNALETGIDAASSLHAARTEIWTAGADGSYGPFGAGTGTVTADSLPPESALVVALQGGGHGVERASDGRLTTEAQRQLSERGLALASPIVANERLQGFVALGRKRNGTAYSKEERDFVEMVASHLAIAFERSSGRTVRLGPYRILERLGTGGMAEVFLAEKRGPGGFELRVALKRMLPHLGDDPDCVAMFLDEARIAAKLSHPNIVRIHDIESLQGRYFIAMELVDGATLAELIRTARQRGEVLPLEVSAAVAVAMLRALRYAHGLTDRHGRRVRLVHRDVKPGNLLVSRQGEVKLGDFGIARAELRLYRTEPGHARGTLPYMAPELWHGRVGPEADLFSAGAVIYEMLTGELAFPAGAAKGRFVPLTARRPELPRALDAFLEQALAREPASRFASAEAMEEAFLRATAPAVPAPGRAVAEVVDASISFAGSRPAPDPSVLVEDRRRSDRASEATEATGRRIEEDLPPTERR